MDSTAVSAARGERNPIKLTSARKAYLCEPISPDEKNRLTDKVAKFFSANGFDISREQVVDLLKNIVTQMDALALNKIFQIIKEHDIERMQAINLVYTIIEKIENSHTDELCGKYSLFQWKGSLSDPRALRDIEDQVAIMVYGGESLNPKVNENFLRDILNVLLPGFDVVPIVAGVSKINSNPFLCYVFLNIIDLEVKDAKDRDRTASYYFLVNSLAYLEDNRDKIYEYAQKDTLGEQLNTINLVSIGITAFGKALSSRGRSLTLEEVKGTLNKLTTVDARDLFTRTILFLDQNGYFNVLDGLSLEGIAEFSERNAETYSKIGKEEAGQFVVFVLLGLEIPQKKLKAYCSSEGMQLSLEMLANVKSIKTIERLNFVLRFFDDAELLAKDYKKENGSASFDMEYFVSGCIYDFANIEEPALERSGNTYKAILTKNYERSNSFFRLAEYIQGLGEEHPAKSIKEAIKGFNPAQSDTFWELVGLIDYENLKESTIVLNLSDIIAFCRDDEKIKHFRSLSSGMLKLDYFFEVHGVQQDRKRIGATAQLFFDTSRNKAILTELFIPLRFASFKLSGAYAGYGNSASGYYHEAMFNRSERLSFGTFQMGIGASYSSFTKVIESGNLESRGNIRNVDLVLRMQLERKFYIGEVEPSFKVAIGARPNILHAYLGFDAEIQASIALGDFMPYLGLSVARAKQETTYTQTYFLSGRKQDMLITRPFANEYYESTLSAGINYELNPKNQLQLGSTLTRFFADSESIAADSVNLFYMRSFDLGRFGLLRVPVGASFSFGTDPNGFALSLGVQYLSQ